MRRFEQVWKNGVPNLGPPREWFNSRTGKTEKIPPGCDPGFDTNPGLAVSRVGWARGWLTQKVATAEPALAQAVVSAWIKSPDFAAFLKSPDGSVPVMLLPDAAAQAIGAQQRLVVLSDQSTVKNVNHHPELTVEDYRQLPEMGSKPDLIVHNRPQTVVIVRHNDKLYWAAIKTTGDRQENFLTSFRRTNSKDIAELIKRGTVVAGGPIEG